MPSTLAILATGVIAIYGFLQLLLHYTQDAREPPPIATAFPFFGSMIGLARKKTKFYVELMYVYTRCLYIPFKSLEESTVNTDFQVQEET